MCVSNKEVSLRAFKTLDIKLKKSEQKNKDLVAERSELRVALRVERKNRKRITFVATSTIALELPIQTNDEFFLFLKWENKK